MQIVDTSSFVHRDFHKSVVRIAIRRLFQICSSAWKWALSRGYGCKKIMKKYMFYASYILIHAEHCTHVEINKCQTWPKSMHFFLENKAVNFCISEYGFWVSVNSLWSAVYIAYWGLSLERHNGECFGWCLFVGNWMLFAVVVCFVRQKIVFAFTGPKTEITSGVMWYEEPVNLHK